MTTYRLLLGLFVLLGYEAVADEAAQQIADRAIADSAQDGALADQFAALKRRFETREKAFDKELRVANTLAAEARAQKITDENQSFQRDWFAMADQVRALVRAHPAEPAAFEGIILLPGLMRSFLDDDIVQIVRAHFMNDPRMGQLCASLAYRAEEGSVAILKDVAAGHPDRKVRGQATYAFGLRCRYTAQEIYAGRDRTVGESDQCLADARRSFTKVTTDYADVASADGTFRLADKATAEMVRIANLPNLKVGKIAPEITGEDLGGKALKLSDHRGKVVVVCFWATWCGPCMAMVPHERELVKRMKGKPFALLGVNSDETHDREKAVKSTREKQMTWPSWWDGGFRGAIQTAYDVDHWPTVYVLDHKGVIRYFDVRGKDLDQAVDTLLAEMQGPSNRDTGK